METRDFTPRSTEGPEINSDASVGDLVKDITQDFSTLIRKEVELAKQEVSEIIRTKLLGASLFLIAGVIAVLILPFALITLIEVLAIWLPRWAASLIVMAAMIGLGMAAFLVARKQFKTKMVPTETIQTIKEDVRWAKTLKK